MHEGLVLLQRTLGFIACGFVGNGGSEVFSLLKAQPLHALIGMCLSAWRRFRVASPEGVLVTTQFATPSVMAGSGLKLQHSST